MHELTCQRYSKAGHSNFGNTIQKEMKKKEGSPTYYYKVPHSAAGGQGHAIQRKHLGRKHVSVFFRANLSFITIKKTELSALNAALGSSGTSTETSTMSDTIRILLLSFTSAVSVQY